MSNPSLIERFGARLAFLHARRVYSKFHRALTDVSKAQDDALQRAMTVIRGSDYARQHTLDAVRGMSELKRAAPLVRYEDIRETIESVESGDTGALFSPGRRLLMFATSSGTTAKQKLIPVTPEFVTDYRRGWNTFGLKMLSDHPKAVLRAILQSSARFDERHTATGIPCGAITGMLAKTQKGIVRRFYVGRPEIAQIADPQDRYYALMRFALARDVAFAITANPATLIRLAQVVNDDSDAMIGDIHNGSIDGISDRVIRRQLERFFRPDAARARELDRLRTTHKCLRPRDYWSMEFLACWTGGSMGHYLRRLGDWYGPLPVRDIGLLASEGRVSMPLDDGTPAGVLDVTAACFEFIPMEADHESDPETLLPTQLEIGHDYAVVLTNTAGLVRYRLDDVVRMRGWVERAPLVEFLYRAGRVASVAGEKLTEHQAVQAVMRACAQFQVPEFDFVLAPHWSDPPYYRLCCRGSLPDGFEQAVDAALRSQNEEYDSRRKSLRLNPLQHHAAGAECFKTLDRKLIAERGSRTEQYKRPSLLTQFGEDEALLSTDVRIS